MSLSFDECKDMAESNGISFNDYGVFESSSGPTRCRLQKRSKAYALSLGRPFEANSQAITFRVFDVYGTSTYQRLYIFQHSKNYTSMRCSRSIVPPKNHGERFIHSFRVFRKGFARVLQ